MDLKMFTLLVLVGVLLGVAAKKRKGIAVLTKVWIFTR